MDKSPRAQWPLDPEVVFLNHGSFGACPRVVLEAQADLRAQMEAQPVRFLQREYEPLLDAARAELAIFLKARPDDLVFVHNATAGVNAVVRSLDFRAGDELLTTDHAYNACRNVLVEAARRSGASVVVAAVPFPLASEEEIFGAIMAKVTDRTRLAMIDHITSPTALVFPVARLITALEQRGVEVLIDGAHAPGAVPLDLDGLRPHYYTGNLHKWVCAPKGAAFLWVRPDRQEAVRPSIVSHGENIRRPGRSAFHDRFDWPGTLDPTAWLSVPAALRFGAGLFAGGWDELRERNRQLAISARALVASRLGVPLPCPNHLLASMAAIALPEPLQRRPFNGERFDPVQVELYEKARVEVPVMRWGPSPRRWLRISAHAYNTTGDYRTLAETVARFRP
ncbi:MAG: aminotransferase class V-fold PLP-dependent enzyme [Chthoniobacteraceae bacterium]